MFIIKIIVGILSVIVFTKIGYDKSKNYKEKLAFYNSITLFCDKFLVELEYKKSHVEKVLKDSYSSSSAKKLFNSYLNDKNNLIFPDFLNNEEKSILSDFFMKLGLGDTDSQKIYVKSYKNTFEKKASESWQNFKKYSNLYLKIGFMFGLTLMIVVI